MRAPSSRTFAAISSEVTRISATSSACWRRAITVISGQLSQVVCWLRRALARAVLRASRDEERDGAESDDRERGGADKDRIQRAARRWRRRDLYRDGALRGCDQRLHGGRGWGSRRGRRGRRFIGRAERWWHRHRDRWWRGAHRCWQR